MSQAMITPEIQQVLDYLNIARGTERYRDMVVLVAKFAFLNDVWQMRFLVQIHPLYLAYVKFNDATADDGKPFTPAMKHRMWQDALKPSKSWMRTRIISDLMNYRTRDGMVNLVPAHIIQEYFPNETYSTQAIAAQKHLDELAAQAERERQKKARNEAVSQQKKTFLAAMYEYHKEQRQKDMTRAEKAAEEEREHRAAILCKNPQVVARVPEHHMKYLNAFIVASLSTRDFMSVDSVVNGFYTWVQDNADWVREGALTELYDVIPALETPPAAPEDDKPIGEQPESEKRLKMADIELVGSVQERTVKQRDAAKQKTFREYCFENFGDRCAISGKKLGGVLEAAHIQHGIRNNPSNGILMAPTFHKLFDRGLMAINPESLGVHFAPGIEWEEYEGKVIAPQVWELDKERLAVRWQEFIEIFGESKNEKSA